MKNTNFTIKGIGNDIIEVSRIQKAVDRHGHHIIDKIFTLNEQNYCFRFSNSSERFAGRFAAKEAVSKALGMGIGTDIGWQDIEVLNDEKGKPYLILSQKIKAQFNNPQILISLSHTSEYATAVAIWI
jgi:holo-[acyl-carrier protein] synthase